MHCPDLRPSGGWTVSCWWGPGNRPEIWAQTKLPPTWQPGRATAGQGGASIGKKSNTPALISPNPAGNLAGSGHRTGEGS